MIAEFSIVPMGVGDSISSHVAKILDLVDKSGLNYKVGPMGTVVEGTWKEIIHLIKDCHDEMLLMAPRVYTRISIDDKKEETGMIEAKVASVESHLNRKLKK